MTVPDAPQVIGQDPKELEPPEDLWLVVEQKMQKNHQTNVHKVSYYKKYLHSEEEVWTMIKNAYKYGNEDEMGAIWHLVDGFWVPYSFGLVLQPSGEGV